MNGSYRNYSRGYEPDKEGRVIHESNRRRNERQQQTPSRADPHGFQISSRRPTEDDAKALAETRLREVMHRSAPPPKHEIRRQSNTRLSEQIAQAHETRDNIWNSSTGAHIGGDPRDPAGSRAAQERDTSAGRDEPGSRSAPARHASSERDLPPYLDRDYSHHLKDRRNGRRVQFSEKLEIDTKSVFPERPKTTLTILRETKRGLPTLSLMDLDAKENLHSGRDPTPKSAEKDRVKRPEPRGDTYHLIVKDPPTNAPKTLLFSPASEIRPPLADHRQSGRRLETKSNVKCQNDMHSREPAATPTARAAGHWNVADIFSSQQRSQSDSKAIRRPKTEVANPNFSGGKPKPRRLDENLRRQSTPVNSSYLRTFSPQSDLRGNQDFFKAFTAADNFTHSWRAETVAENIFSPNKSTQESPRDYLISKYSKGQKPPTEENCSVSSSPFGAISPTAAASRSHQLSPTSPPGAERKGRRAIKQVASWNLQDDEAEERGTEMMMLPRFPQQIKMQSSEYEAVYSPGKAKDNKKRGPRGFLRRTPKDAVSERSFDEFPILAVKCDDSIDLQKSTGSETEDSESGVYFSGKSGWDRFEAESEKSFQDFDTLIPSKGMSKRKKRWIVIFALFVFLVLGVALGYHFGKKSRSTSHAADAASTSACASGNSNFEFSDRYIAIRNHLVEKTDAHMISVAGTPQRMAACWVADFDERAVVVDANNTAPLVQRYTMGVLFYTLANDESDPTSLANTDFLSTKHECEWEVVICGIPETVTALLLADKFLSGVLPSEIENLAQVGEYS